MEINGHEIVTVRRVIHNLQAVAPNPDGSTRPGLGTATDAFCDEWPAVNLSTIQ
jgi:hypothetical protein